MNNSDKQLSFQNFFLSLLNELSKREQEVLKKRYQLSADVPAKNTLKQIGDVYGITRERVRQIEKEAIGKLVIQSKADNYQSQINEFEKALKNFLAQKGGVVSENDLIENHISQVYHFDELHVNSFLFTIENLIKGVERNNENQDYYSFWHVSEIEQELIEKIVNDIASVLTTRKTVVSEADLHSLIENEVVAELQHVHLANLAEQTGKSLLDFAKSYIEVTKKVEDLPSEIDPPYEILALSIDRVDYTKGIVEKIRAVDRFLEKYPQYQKKFVFFQKGALSRLHIKTYKNLIDEIQSIAEEINWKYRSGNWYPIVLLNSKIDYATHLALYRACDLCLVGSLHDGMNLVAKEFISANVDLKGMLLLSKFTGAARELKEAVLVNPYDIESVADAMKEAIEMSPDEKKDRIKKMRENIQENNIYKWAGKFIANLVKI